MNQNFLDIIENISDRDPRFRPDVYPFVLEALSYTQKKFKKDRHVSGKELLAGMKELLMKRYGPMTMTVLEHWGIKSTEDFGHVVFNLVENRLLSKTEDDCLDEFRDRYDFKEVFDHGYRKHLARKISRMR
jgi:uncharacterized repeat protein (TIGR04138 family)